MVSFVNHAYIQLYTKIVAKKEKREKTRKNQ